MTKYDDIINRLETDAKPDRALDVAIAELVHDIEWRPYSPGKRKMWGFHRGSDKVLFFGTDAVPTYTLSLDKALLLLPDGFWWRGGTCCVSSEATVCPDHNDPEHRERLMRECPPSVDHWNEGIEVCLTPGSDMALIRALASACLRARHALISACERKGYENERQQG